MARPFPWKCRTCGEPKVNPAVTDYSADLEHDGRAYHVTVPDLHILECAACGTRVLPDEAHRRLALVLREKAGLLTPKDIKDKRDKLGLTQQALAHLLRVAPETVSRWETGAQIQQRAMDLLLRVFFDVPQMRQYLEDLQGGGGKRVGPVATAPAGPLPTRPSG